MKTAFWMVFAVWVGALSAGAAGSKTEAEFTQAIQAALKEKSASKFDALFYKEGLSPADQAQNLENTKERMEFDTGEILSVSLVALPPDFQASRIGFGKRVELAREAQGLVEVKSKGAFGTGTTRQPYGLVSGAYYLLPTRSVDLGWKGPEDKQLSVQVSGAAKGSGKLVIRYNASGVSCTHEAGMGQSIVIGQYFEEVLLTSSDPKAAVTFTLKEGDQEVYKSEQLTGAGKLTYKRKP